MLAAKRAPLYCSLCLIAAIISMALFTILIQSRQQSGTLWAGRAADLYAQSLDISQDQSEQAQILAQSHAAMLSALQNDPYNAPHWLRLSVIERNLQTMKGDAAVTDAPHSPAIDIIKRLNAAGTMNSADYILPSKPSKPSAKPD